jgi:hypothetical protein
MKGATRNNLRTARSLFCDCAQKLEATRLAGAQLPQLEREMQVGFGLCADWQRWAGALDDISFSTRAEERSSRTQGLIETTRFTYIWTGINSLFSRDSILARAVAPNALPNLTSELRRFRILYDFAQLPAALVAAEHTLLNNILGMQCQAEPLPGAPNKPSYTMWEVIFYKYIVPGQRNIGIGGSIATALAAGNIPALDVPTIIYGARNWNVHGVLISSSFRGSKQKHLVFIESIILLLSEMLARAAIRFDGLL